MAAVEESTPKPYQEVPVIGAFCTSPSNELLICKLLTVVESISVSEFALTNSLVVCSVLSSIQREHLHSQRDSLLVI